MAVRSVGRKLSFDVLANPDYDDVMSFTFSPSNSDPQSIQNDADSSSQIRLNRNKSKKKKKKKAAKILESTSSIVSENSVINGDISYSCTMSTVTESAVVPEVESDSNCTVSRPLQFGELRQRNVSYVINGESSELVIEESGNGKIEDNVNEVIGENRSAGDERDSGRIIVLEGSKTEDSLYWNKLMADDPKNTLPVEKSPMKYFMEEMYAGNSLQSTTTLGNDKERERVYDTIFRLPWRCELVIDVGLFICFDSFLSLLTIMPTRIIMSFWKLLKMRQFKRPSSAELSDFGCFIVLVTGVTLLQQADISLIYHMIRGQGTIKLYVVYNVLEIFDRLCQNFGGDIMQALFNSADGLANCSPENMQFWLWRFISDEALAIASSNILAITLSTCIVAHNNALFAMLVSNNFAEIKGNVFKRYSKDNVQSLVYFDSVERFHISAFILFVLAQNILEAEGPWFESFLCNALVVYICEVMIDIIKHSFVAKFNDIKPIAFSEFLEDLCNQMLNIQTENAKKNLTFVPLAPACVVIRVFRPVYAAHLPHNPFLWRLFWIFVLFAVTFVMLASLKMMIGMGLQKFARWYIKRCQKRKLHSD
ncbi:hypothetical protein ACJIZ3_012920 [Penstemon smallii]|uniref:Protein POLLEN DEFECTIVE IN GUIDANCE 1 n=1 Tax=Penstemon smallii TaxID=265156 RepID=A0ABD3URL1_9LAMI